DSFSDSVANVKRVSLDVSADGSRLAFARGVRSTGPGIRVIDGGGARDVLQATGADVASRLTADGTKVFFIVNDDTNLAGSNTPLPAGLYVLNLVNGGGPTRLVSREDLAPLADGNPQDVSFQHPTYKGVVSRGLDVSDDGSRVVFGAFALKAGSWDPMLLTI